MELAVRTPLEKAERTRRKLLELGVIDFSRRVRKENGHLLIPVLQDVEDEETIERALPEKEPQKDLRSALAGELAEDELNSLKTAYDLVGDIAILEIDEGLRHRETLIGETLLELFPNIKVVVRKHGAHQGELRLQDYKHLAGEERFETTVVEHGVRLSLDIRKAYYSVRSATERKRVAELVAPDEEVLIMFSGIGPFICVIAKHTEAKRVVGVELNEDGHHYAERNIARNKLTNAHALQGDVRTVVPTLGSFDRIVMPLPHTAEDFLNVAVPATKPGGMIHLYHFSSEEEARALAEEIPERLETLGRSGRVEHLERCGNLAPSVHRWTLDIRID